MGSNSSSQKFTLTVNGNKVEPPERFPDTISLNEVLNQSDIVRERNGTILTSTNPENAVYASLGNSFIGCLWDAYSNHYKLVLRPDDLWLTIMIAFADYVDNHAEEMRKAFVTHNGKKQLIVTAEGNTSTIDWTNIIAAFSDLINEHTIGEVRDWVEPKFTTTTPNDSLIARVALMGAMKHYFSFGAYLCCGIPEVTLLGTLEDWQDLRTRVDKLSKYGEQTNQTNLTWWRNILIPIIDKFIESYKGNVDNDFWQSCATYLGGGSGPSYVSGWALAFSPFNKGQWRLNHPDDIALTGCYGKVETGEFETSATVEVPIKINDNGNEYNACFYAGGIVNKYDNQTDTITPSFDFAMFKLPDSEVSDEIQWDKPSGTLINSPVVSLTAGKSEFVTVHSHEHALTLHVYDRNHRCDICNVAGFKAAYRCTQNCDYDCCFDCTEA